MKVKGSRKLAKKYSNYHKNFYVKLKKKHQEKSRTCSKFIKTYFFKKTYANKTGLRNLKTL